MEKKWDAKLEGIENSSDDVFIKIGLCWMGIFMIIIATIPKSFHTIIHRRSNSISESFFSFDYLYIVVNFAPCQCHCMFVSCLSYILSMFFFFFCLYIVMNFSDELDFCS
jgi:hypothetical protein